MAIDTLNELAIGIDIGGTNTKYGVVNHRGIIVEKGVIRTDKHDDVDLFINELYTTLQPVMEKYQQAGSIKGIGVGAPNGNFFKGTIEHAPNLQWKGVIPFAKLMSQKFNLPCLLTKDASAAASGEMAYGAARGMKNFIMITLGTGVGSGVVVNGHVVYGQNGYAGELGHTMIRHGGRLHKSTKLKGTLEAYASATGIVATAVELMSATNDESLLRQYKKAQLNSKVIYECAQQGDKMAKKVFDFTGKILGEALANFVMFSSPEAIVLFGGVIKAGNLLMVPTSRSMEKSLLPIFKGKVKLLFSELDEADAAILGASALVWEIKQPADEPINTTYEA